MHSSIFLLAAAIGFGSVIATPSPQVTGTPTGLPLGAKCDPTIANVCANGVHCYAVNSMLIPSCGNFQASCTSDSQCAFNTCNAGLCNGVKSSSTSTTPSTPSTSKPTGSNLPLGAECDYTVPNQCAGGAACYGVNSGIIPRCGNFQSPCTSDSQCAFNLCQKSLCGGMKPSSSVSTSSPSTGAPKPTGTNLPLGAECDYTVAKQCAGGAACYGVNSGIIPRCGNFQSPCTSDAQCAFNKCVNSLCGGPLLSSSISSNTSTGGNAPITSSTTANSATITPNTGVQYENTTQTLVPINGYTTSVVVVNGKSTSTPANKAGGTSAPSAKPTGGAQPNGVGKLAGGLGGLFAVAFGAVIVL